jgi:hypothetical protein
MSSTYNDIWIEATAAVDVAKQGILDYQLDRNSAVASTIQNGYPEIPLLVERIDKPKSAYYLISWTDTEGVVFVVEVDAIKGIMLGATIFPKPVFSPFLTPDGAIDCATQKFPRHIFATPRLVWCPCRESTNPILPFYELLINEDVLYVDMDGSIFSELTPLGFGGGESV